ncbi:MAG: right-handed parallel beta-helix repeat-containing protein [Prolixibacteraceae bacterium]|nr:right-handed parallel beta-helix repeat-containing protein [Prolixibacteraceae bacterium]
MIKIRDIIRTGLIFVAALAAFACNPTEETYQGPNPDKSVYGPQVRVYELPDITGKIYFVAPDGDAPSEGNNIENPTTIESAIARATTGDAIIMRGGTYRTGNLTFNQGITIQPYRDEQPVLNGTFVANNWIQTTEGLWATNWDYLFPASPESWWNRERNEKFTPLHRFNNDGVFIDGKFLESAGSIDEVSERSCFVDYDARKIYIGANPTGKLVEITAYRKAIMRTTADVHGKKSDGRGPVIRGLTITQYPDTMVHIDGYYPQGISPESENGKDVVGTVFENCTFSKCFRIGVFAIGDSMVMRNCKITDTNTEGLYLVASSDVLLERNIFANNNIERWTGFFPSSVKIFNQTHRVVCRGNLIIDQPNSNGLWYDVGNKDGVFVNNWVENIGNVEKFREKEHMWSNYSGFFYEISSDAICAGNVFLNCEQGSFVLNSAGVRLYNNTYINSPANFGRNNRGDDADHFGWHIRTGPGVEERDNNVLKNNLFYMEEGLARTPATVWQPAFMCERLPNSQLAAINNNFYAFEEKEIGSALISWSPADNEDCSTLLNIPDELTALYPEFATESKLLNMQADSIFTGYDQNDFNLLPETSAICNGAVLPGDVVSVLKLKENDASFVGAY